MKVLIKKTENIAVIQAIRAQRSLVSLFVRSLDVRCGNGNN